MRDKYITLFLSSLFLALLAVGCRGEKDHAEADEPVTEKELVVKNDSMVYGLVCDGTSDSVIVLWPFSGEPMTLNCIVAKQNGRIIGQPEIGDWTGVMINREDTTEVTLAVNLDQLKGTWTYPVMPVMKDLQHMSKRMQRRMIANLPDSVKQTFFIPREYGFTLKRSHKAQPVGTIMRTSTLEDDSPVQYPKVKRYKQWHMWNGKLLLVSGDRPRPEDGIRHVKPDAVDTLQFVYMDNDSLILLQNGKRISYHRKQNAIKANEVATKAVEKQEEASKKVK